MAKPVQNLAHFFFRKNARKKNRSTIYLAAVKISQNFGQSNTNINTRRHTKKKTDNLFLNSIVYHFFSYPSFVLIFVCIACVLFQSIYITCATKITKINLAKQMLN